jgi:hypothetical protein
MCPLFQQDAAQPNLRNPRRRYSCRLRAKAGGRSGDAPRVVRHKTRVSSLKSLYVKLKTFGQGPRGPMQCNDEKKTLSIRDTNLQDHRRAGQRREEPDDVLQHSFRCSQCSLEAPSPTSSLPIYIPYNQSHTHTRATRKKRKKKSIEKYPTSPGRSPALVHTALSLEVEQQSPGVLDGVLDGLEEGDSLAPVHQPVVVRQRHVHHGTRHDLVANHHGVAVQVDPFESKTGDHIPGSMVETRRFQACMGQLSATAVQPHHGALDDGVHAEDGALRGVDDGGAVQAAEHAAVV